MRIMNKPLLILLCLALVVSLPNLSSRESGIDSTANNGCLCHGGSNSNTQVILHNLPDNWTANTTYNFSVEVIGADPDESGNNAGGFRLQISLGELSGDNDVQILSDGLTHTSLGNDQRMWDVQWTTPSDATQIAHITLHGNAVNGDESTTGDAWSSFEYELWGVNATEGTYVEQPDMFPIMAFAIIIIGLGIAYFLVINDGGNKEAKQK